MFSHELMSQVEFGELYSALIERPIEQGMNQLVAVSGFASGAFVQHLFEEYDHLQIKLIIGMAKRVGIPEADHSIYNNLVDVARGRLECKYYVGSKGVHAKAYAWLQDENPSLGVVGSANLSWNGFRYYDEVASYSDPFQIIDIYQRLLTDSLSVTDVSINETISLIDTTAKNAVHIAAAHGAPHIRSGVEAVELSLLTAQGNMHQKSGLNWGQRSGRDPNQAYIPVRRIVHKKHPGFFPPNGQRFTVKTDDGETMVCVIAQQNDKAVETTDDNSELGLYFRRRLGLANGVFVKKEDLENYGRTSVKFIKIDDDLFIMDFSIK